MTTRQENTKFQRFEKDFMHKVYPLYSESDKRGLWWGLLVHHFLFPGLIPDPLYCYTPKDYQKWKSFDDEVDKYIDMIMEDIFDYGPWSKEDNLEDVTKKVNDLLGRT